MSQKTASPVTSAFDERAELALIGLALVWGTSHVITKNILTVHTPFYYASWRFGIAALCFGALFAGHLRKAQPSQIAQGALLGLFSFTGIVCYSIGLVFTAASKAGFITGLYLVFTPLLAFLFFRIRPALDHVIGLAVAILGFGILSFPQGGTSFNWGDGLILFAALAWAAHIAATSAFARQSEVKTLAAVQVIVVAILAIAVHLVLRQLTGTALPAPFDRLLLLEARPNHFTTATFMQVAYMALVVTFVAALVQTWAQGKVATTHTALLYALEPVTAALFAWAVLGESLTWRSVAGALLIIFGVLISRLGLIQRLQPAAVNPAVANPGRLAD